MNDTMNPVLERPTLWPNSTKRMAKPVNFYCHAYPGAKSVNLVGDFNDWNLNSLPMQRQPDDWWFIQVPLTHGHHQYVFLVDGEPELDPHATGTVPIDPFGKASIISVS